MANSRSAGRLAAWRSCNLNGCNFYLCGLSFNLSPAARFTAAAAAAAAAVVHGHCLAPAGRLSTTQWAPASAAGSQSPVEGLALAFSARSSGRTVRAGIANAIASEPEIQTEREQQHPGISFHFIPFRFSPAAAQASSASETTLEAAAAALKVERR